MMMIIFWDFHSVVIINYLEKRKINGEYHAVLLLNNAKIKDPLLAKKKTLYFSIMTMLTLLQLLSQNYTNCISS